MRIPRLFVDLPLGSGATIEITDERAHYLRNVLRLRPGAQVSLFNGESGEWRATMTGIERRTISLDISERLRAPRKVPGPSLYFSPIRRNRLEWMLEKAVEFGVAKLVPVLTERSVVELGRVDRLRARLIEAAEQCERIDVPEIEDAQTLEDVIGSGVKLVVGVERHKNGSLLQALEELPDAGLLVGPEGGFTDDERRMLGEADARMVSFGPLILRSETAVLHMLSVWRALENDVVEGDAGGE
ncbi:MAG: 16S rRNA (uracil(1498)-N(3))-methyltransferase [Geminicoccaceae bacterium]|nr:16S rRNA (uracil(1498)-N(3))-methyltransferase [Geminicoccaceae bacterium]MCB9943289.1 16S rRNA (uracil(1498)-N(3))-methyltransferase [Geminicoccaceae bacterium]